MTTMKFKTTIEKFAHNPTWGHHFPVPTEYAEPFLQGEDRRILLKINDNPEIHCALMPGGDNTWFITATAELRKKLSLSLGEEVTLHIRKDESKYGIALPAEMKEILETDDEGSRVFHGLTPGKQRSLLYITGKPKTSNTRIKKALMVIDYLKSVNGNLDFKELNEFFKLRKNDY